MKIYTSYFSNYRNFPKEAVPVAITLYPPKGYKGLIYKKLAPTKDILMEFKEDGDKETYTTKYVHDVLKKLNQHIVVNELLKLSNIQPIILLCYEKSDDFCHRHIVADWLKEEGYKVEEIPNEKNRKIIFLDVDGVLNSEDDCLSISPEELLKMPCEVFDRPLTLLKQIIDKTGAEVVISSSWRITLFRETAVLYNKLVAKLNEFNIMPIDVTPYVSGEGKQRGDEIRAWLKSNRNVSNFVILDDDSDMCEFTETNLVQTTYEHGLREKHVEKAIEILIGK